MADLDIDLPDIPDDPTPEQMTAYLDSLPPVGAPFVLRRDEDISGISGTGIVADGMVFPDHRVATRWRAGTSGVAQTCTWDSLHHVRKIHGHDGATKVVTVPVGALKNALKGVLAIPRADKGDYATDQVSAGAWDDALDHVHEAIADALSLDMDLDAEVAAMDAERAATRKES